jgi:subtilisin-like proprotein convertase family protein
MFVAALVLAADLRLELVRYSLTGGHCRYREYVEGLPTDDYVTKPCAETAVSAVAVSPEAAGLRRIVGGRIARRVIRDRHAYDYDAATGALLRTIPLFFRAGRPARVFDPNPVASQNDPALQDRNDSPGAVPDAAYRSVELQDVAPSGPLRGPNVALIDRQAPNVAPPDGSGSLVFNRGDDGFEDVSAYFHIDAAQRYLQSLGYVGERSIAAYPIEVDAHAGGGSDNSFFLPSLTAIGRGTLAYGEGGTDDAEDADIVVHEYGHAILEWIAPGSFAGSFASQARALAEGFGDYWAFTQHVAARLASGRDPYCFADWDARCAEDDPSQQCAYPAGSDCLRRLDSPKTMADYDVREQSGVEHANGAIWSSALRELHQHLGKPIADTIILESLFDLPPLPTYAAAAHRIVEADQQLYGGAHVAEICAVMAARGIVADCAFTPRGELTHFQSGDHGLAIPDNQLTGITSSLTIADARIIDELYVRVDVAHTARGDLRIELIAPDGTTVVLKEQSGEGEHDVRTTFGLTAASAQPLTIFRGRSAAGVWQLRVTDLRPRDSGTLRSWDLVVKFAGAAPSATRPRGAHAQMIPVVAHLFGTGATEFASDVRISNPAAEPVTATLIFTRSGDNGFTSFAAIDVALAAGQTVAYDDVVATAFLTAGSGNLEVLGDVVVMSRTYDITALGTMGQQVPAQLDSTVRDDSPLYAVALPDATFRGTRLNLGITETAGGSGTVRVNDQNYAVAPFSHVQFATTSATAKITVVSGDARVVAYVSQVDNTSGDAMFLPAVRRRPDRKVMAPALSAAGVNGIRWRTDLWLIVPESDFLFGADFFYLTGTERVPPFELSNPDRDTVAFAFRRPGTVGAIEAELPGQLLAFTRIATDGMSEFVPFVDIDGPAEQHLVFIESGSGYRTNIGILSDAAAIADVIVYDSSGAEVERQTLATSGGVAQTAVRTRVAAGRAVVRFRTGHGRAYASLIDNGTSDATFIESR